MFKTLMMNTIIWLNAAVFITLVEKMDAATIQNRPLLNALRRCLYP